MSTRLLLAVLGSTIVLGAVYAMAATLGGITTADVGADNAVVASCDTNGVTTAYTNAWDATDKRYEISGVTVGGVNDACDGDTMKVTLADTGGAQIGEGTLVIPTSAATSFAVTMSPAASAKLVEGVHVIIGA